MKDEGKKSDSVDALRLMCKCQCSFIMSKHLDLFQRGLFGLS